MTTPNVGLSTAPAAIAALKAHCDVVATASPLQVSTHLGQVLGGANDNFICLGDPTDGSPLMTDYVAADQPNIALDGPCTIFERYCLWGYVRTYTAGNDPQARLNDAHALIGAIRARLAADRLPDALNGGWWFLAYIDDVALGKLNNSGVGTTMRFRVDITNAAIFA